MIKEEITPMPNNYIAYNNLMELYTCTIINLIDISNSMKILPLKVMFGINYIKNHIMSNRFEILQTGLNYILTNKDLILNFNLNRLDELDIDSDDNTSIKSCVKKYKKSSTNNTNNQNQNSFLTESNPDEILELIISVKNNAKKLSIDDIIIIKKYFELLIDILEQIQKIFI